MRFTSFSSPKDFRLHRLNHSCPAETLRCFTVYTVKEATLSIDFTNIDFTNADKQKRREVFG